MRLATLRLDDRPTTGHGPVTRAAVREGEHYRLLDAVDVADALRRRIVVADDATAGETVPAGDARFAPLVTTAAKIICIGQNYREHIAEMGHEPPAHPNYFVKFLDSLIGAHDDIVLPPESHKIDWEVELALVVGRPLRRATPEEAMDALAGVTVSSDVSARDWQRRTSQWLPGKVMEGLTPLGPELVSLDEVDLEAGLRVTTRIDGETMQDGTTADMVFSPGEILADLSRFTTLRPGDVVLTGTPSGVGAGREPQRFLRSGELLVTTIEGVGELRNRVV